MKFFLYILGLRSKYKEVVEHCAQLHLVQQWRFCVDWLFASESNIGYMQVLAGSVSSNQLMSNRHLCSM